MILPRLFLCGGEAVAEGDPVGDGRLVVTLCTTGPEANVNVRLFDLVRMFMRHLLPRLEDALEIAAYVFAADCATRRGGQWGDDDSSEPWPRDLRFVIPVRDLAFWVESGVATLMAEALRFLSTDAYSFVFRQYRRPDDRQQYLELGDDEDWPFHGVDRVLMFSGGLDSLMNDNCISRPTTTGFPAWV